MVKISLLSCFVGLLFSESVVAHRKRHDDKHWVDIWATMPQLTEPANLPPAPFNGTSSVFANSTIRQTIHLTQTASKIRLRLSNVFGVNELPITAVTIALPFNGSAGVSAIQPRTLKTVTFSRSSSFSIPNGALVVSDPIDIDVKAQSVLSISIYLATGQPGFSITSHPGSRTTSWFSFGNVVGATNFTDVSVQSAAHWYFISAVEAWLPRGSRALAIVGDSITDGRGSTTDRNNRWPDLLLAAMQKRDSTADIAILNQAAGGNRILIDGLGPNALGRLDRDVFSHSGVEYALIFEGVNDIGTGDVSPATQKAIGDRLIAAFKQIIIRVQAFEIPIFAATITPFSGNATIQPYSDPEREKTRQRVNKWIREEGDFDAVLDFDMWLRDPNNVSQLSPLYNGGDFLHPNVAGYQRIADLFPLKIFD